MSKLIPQNSLVMVIDVQEKLVNMLEKDTIVQKTAKLVQAAKILDIPVIVTEQYPKGLGATLDVIKANLGENTQFYEKTSFSALDTEGIEDKLKKSSKKQIVLCGIETHICVHQTCAALIDAGYEVYIIKDACASRNKYEFKQGIEIMRQNGAKISCLEIALFEWLGSAKHPNFKEVQALIK